MDAEATPVDHAGEAVPDADVDAGAVAAPTAPLPPALGGPASAKPPTAAEIDSWLGRIDDITGALASFLAADPKEEEERTARRDADRAAQRDAALRARVAARYDPAHFKRFDDDAMIDKMLADADADSDKKDKKGSAASLAAPGKAGKMSDWTDFERVALREGDRLRREGNDAAKAGDWATAAQRYGCAIGLGIPPEEPDGLLATLHNNMALAEGKLGNHASAAQHATACLARERHNLKALLRRAAALLALHRPRDALRDADAALRADRGNAEGAALRAKALRAAAEVDACDALRRAHPTAAAEVDAAVDTVKAAAASLAAIAAPTAATGGAAVVAARAAAANHSAEAALGDAALAACRLGGLLVTDGAATQARLRGGTQALEDILRHCRGNAPNGDAANAGGNAAGDADAAAAALPPHVALCAGAALRVLARAYRPPTAAAIFGEAFDAEAAVAKTATSAAAPFSGDVAFALALLRRGFGPTSTATATAATTKALPSAAAGADAAAAAVAGAAAARLGGAAALEYLAALAARGGALRQRIASDADAAAVAAALRGDDGAASAAGAAVAAVGFVDALLRPPTAGVCAAAAAVAGTSAAVAAEAAADAASLASVRARLLPSLGLTARLPRLLGDRSSALRDAAAGLLVRLSALPQVSTDDDAPANAAGGGWDASTLADDASALAQVAGLLAAQLRALTGRPAPKPTPATTTTTTKATKPPVVEASAFMAEALLAWLYNAALQGQERKARVAAATAATGLRDELAAVAAVAAAGVEGLAATIAAAVPSGGVGVAATPETSMAFYVDNANVVARCVGLLAKTALAAPDGVAWVAAAPAPLLRSALALLAARGSDAAASRFDAAAKARSDAGAAAAPVDYFDATAEHASVLLAGTHAAVAANNNNGTLTSPVPAMVDSGAAAKMLLAVVVRCASSNERTVGNAALLLPHVASATLHAQGAAPALLDAIKTLKARIDTLESGGARGSPAWALAKSAQKNVGIALARAVQQCAPMLEAVRALSGIEILYASLGKDL